MGRGGDFQGYVFWIWSFFAYFNAHPNPQNTKPRSAIKNFLNYLLDSKKTYP